MRVGIPTEMKNNEHRVATSPSGAAELVRRGNDNVIDAGAGDGSVIANTDYRAAGAELVDTADRRPRHISRR